MSYGIYLSRSALAVLVLGLLGASAHAQFSGGPVPGVEPKTEHYGLGFGRMVMPTLVSPGLLTGVLVDEKEGERYALDATLMTLLSGGQVPGQHFAFGTLHGELSAVQDDGPFNDADPGLEAYVEGTWKLGKNLLGTYEAFIYQRSKAGSLELSGVIYGRFHVAVVDAPKDPPGAAKNPLKSVVASQFETPRPDYTAAGGAIASELLIGAFKARFKLLD